MQKCNVGKTCNGIKFVNVINRNWSTFIMRRNSGVPTGAEGVVPQAPHWHRPSNLGNVQKSERYFPANLRRLTTDFHSYFRSLLRSKNVIFE